MSRVRLIAVPGWFFGRGLFDCLFEQLGHLFDAVALDGTGAPRVAPWDAAGIDAPGDPLVLVGWSLGAVRCLSTAISHPERVRGLVLLSATARLMRDAPDYPGVEPSVLRAMRVRLRRDPEGCRLDFLSACLTPVPGNPRSAATPMPVSAGGTVSTACVSGTDAESGLRMLLDTDLRDGLSRLRMPVRLLHGTCDAVVPFSQGVWLSEHLPNATLETFEGAKHWPPKVMWDAAAAALRELAVDPDGVCA